MSLFIDPNFPPNTRSLSSGFLQDSHLIEWKRPGDISRNYSPQFILEGARRHDLDQGALGDCWFIASASALATHHRAEFERVVPKNQSFDRRYYTGKFYFNFFLNGGWKTVEVDDYLPTRAGRLIYCSNRERPYEFWPCLLEKAYAKAKGCYTAIDGGKIKNALEDLTGGQVVVKDIRFQNQGWDQLYSELQTASNRRAVMAAAIHRMGGDAQMPNGLIQGHAYSITGYHQLNYYGRDVNLIRLRNPWGRGEWNGAWSDRSPEMMSISPRQQQALKFHTRDDGEFWMEFNEFVRNFHEINICYV